MYINYLRLPNLVSSIYIFMKKEILNSIQLSQNQK